VRLQVGHNAQPSSAIIDSPSAKTTEQGGPHSFDGDKKINGRKRHLLVETHGLLLKAVTYPAGVHDASAPSRRCERFMPPSRACNSSGRTKATLARCARGHGSRQGLSWR